MAPGPSTDRNAPPARAEAGTAGRHGRRRTRIRRSAPGTAPGTLVGDADAVPPEGLVEEEVADTTRLRAFVERWPVSWINVDGVRHAPTVASLGEVFALHRLALEDVINLNQRPKVERYPSFLFIVARLITRNDRVETSQLSLFVGERFVLTFQECPGTWFEAVRARIRGGQGRIRVGGPGYLAYALLDAVVDHHFPVLEGFGEHIEALEDEIVERPSNALIGDIRAIKRDLLTLRRAIWPLRETLNALLRESGPYFADEDRPFLQDCYDHAVQVMDLVESYREVGSGLMDVYLSSVSNRMNEVMKVLTMFASIFIPLSFIAGVYGMNFDATSSPYNLPELHWYWGYPFALTLMGAVALGLLSFFHRRGWIGGRRRAPRGVESDREPPGKA
jgi:magnesium transporter